MASFSYPFSRVEVTLAQALRFLAAAELEACNQYEQLLDRLESSTHRESILHILKEENEHLEILLSLLESVSPASELGDSLKQLPSIDH